MPDNSLAAFAASLSAAGLSVIPCNANKRPTEGWSEHKTTPLTPEEWATRSPACVAVVCGYGGVECIDFDLAGVAWSAWRRRVLARVPDLLTRVYVETSPSGGWHVMYRTSAPLSNTKLTSWSLSVGDDESGEVERHGRTLRWVRRGDDVFINGGAKGHRALRGVVTVVPIETRGLGGYVLVAPSPGYAAVTGDLRDLPLVTDEEHAAMLDTARALSDAAEGAGEGAAKTSLPRAADDDFQIGTWYAQHGDHKAVLSGAGWTYDSTRGDNEYWIRPGKKTGVSASWSLSKRLFYVFSNNAAPLEMTCAKGDNLASEETRAKAYSLLRLRATLEYGGDYRLCIKDIVKEHPEEARKLEAKREVAELVRLMDEEGEGVADETLALMRRDLMREGADEESFDPKVVRVYGAVRKYMHKHGLSVSAHNTMLERGRISTYTSEVVVNEVSVHLKSDETTSTELVREVLSTIRRKDARARRDGIIARMTGKPTTKAGREALRAWLTAVTGEVRPADEYAMRHLMWNVKTRMLDGHGRDHHAVVLYGELHGAGKSEAINKLISPWGEMASCNFSMANITDDRCRPSLSKYAIANLEELAGIAKADLAALKANITAPTTTYRPMGTNDDETIPVRVSFIGSSNDPVDEVVRDPSGNRRWYQITTNGVLDWSAVNRINYEELWQCVSEQDEAPGCTKEGRALLAAAKSEQRHQDTVALWLEHEESSGWGEGTIDAMDECEGAPIADLYDRYRAYTKRTGGYEVGVKMLVRRLKAAGWGVGRARNARTRVLRSLRPGGV